MSKRLIRKLHKWIAVGTGLVLAGWLISGIVMTVPVTWLARLAGMEATEGSEAPAPDFRDMRVGVVEVLATLDLELGRRARATAISVTTLQSRPVYRVSLDDGSVHLVDGETGKPIRLTETLAEKLARDALPAAGRINGVELIERRDFHYFGPLPAYKVVFAEPRGNVVYVAASTGAVQRSTSLSRLRRYVTSLHELEPLRLINESTRLQIAAMIILSSLTLVVVASGFYLALPARRRAGAAAGRI